MLRLAWRERNALPLARHDIIRRTRGIAEPGGDPKSREVSQPRAAPSGNVVDPTEGQDIRRHLARGVRAVSAVERREESGCGKCINNATIRTTEEPEENVRSGM